jgi:hypothetical protein
MLDREDGLMSALIEKVTSRERLTATLTHKQPDRIPLDFGGTAVTGVHASCVAALRDYYGLEKRPVRIHEPFQMLAMIDDDLFKAMGLDVAGVFPRNTMFGFPVDEWKPWRFNGLDVLVGKDFNTTVEASGDTLIYPGGDTTVAASGRMPRGGYFFDCIRQIIVRSSATSRRKISTTLNARPRPQRQPARVFARPLVEPHSVT